MKKEGVIFKTKVERGGIVGASGNTAIKVLFPVLLET